MNKNESKYFNTALKMDTAFLELLEHKDFEFITVKEICKKAGVNRSTFYLHYETIDDLINECTQYINEHFNTYMNHDCNDFIADINSLPVDRLYLMTPEYLEPYLRYIMEHKRLFSIAIKNTTLLRLEQNYDKMFQTIFNPILERYNVPIERRKYVMEFYIHGLMAIIYEWLKNDCSDSIEDIINIMCDCVISNKNT